MPDLPGHYIDSIEDHLRSAFTLAQYMEKDLQELEGDSDLFRKVSYYLVPSLNHWLVGAQAGNIKDLRDTLAKRFEEAVKAAKPAAQGNGHEILTKK